MAGGGATKQRKADPRWTLAACVLASSLSFVDGSVLNVALPAIRASYGAGAAEVQWVVNAYLLLCRRCCCSAARSATISAGAGCWSSAPSCSGSPLRSARWRRASVLLGRARRARGRRGAAAAQQPRLAQRRLRGREARPGGRHLGRGRRRRRRRRAADRRLAGRPSRLAGDLLHQPAARRRRHLLALRFVTESRDPGSGATDYAGALLATAGLAALTYGLTLWSSKAGSSRRRIGAMVAGLACCSPSSGSKRREDRAMMPLALFEDRCFTGLNLVTLLLYGAFGAVMLLVPYVLIEAAGYSPVQAGLALLPLPILLTIGSPIMGQLAARMGPAIAA